MNVQDEIKALKQRIAELEQQSKQEQEFPQYGDTYWCINTYGGVSKEIWDGYDIEKDMLVIGNGFRTEQEAVFAVEKLKVEAELRKFSRPFEEDGDNYFILINSSHNNIVIDSDECYQTQGTIYFDSKEKAKQAIESVGEEHIKKYIFEVED